MTNPYDLDNFNLENKTDLIFNLQKSLTSKAKTWLYMIQDQIKTFKDFETEFKNSFWNESIQNNLNWKIAYEKNTSLTRVQYATNIFTIAQDLNMSESEIIINLKNHFKRDFKI